MIGSARSAYGYGITIHIRSCVGTFWVSGRILLRANGLYDLMMVDKSTRPIVQQR